MNADPTAFSSNGGRWAPSSDGRFSVQVLYTSLTKEGAIAEVASYLTLLAPLPTETLWLHRLRVTTKRTVIISRTDFGSLGISDDKYGLREYERTQEIGAMVNYLEIDGLIAPSARWPSENLMVFGDNHALDEILESVESEPIDWQAWAKANGML